MTRRTAISLATGPLLSRAAGTIFDPNFGSALEASAAIRARHISSVELTKHVFARIDRFQPTLNAFVYQLREEALLGAQRVDQAIAHRDPHLPPFAGVPILIKESFGLAGKPCTWGIPALKNTHAPANSTAVQRLLDAGAIITGATNVPFELTDGQSYNEIYGVTNNPWNPARTPGGSSGGAAAALAAGLGFLGIGSDLAGSVRSPAHCCGVFGHKSSLDVVSLRGQTPGGALADPGFSTLLAVAGPLARTAQDLEAALSVLGGPELPDSVAYTWSLPKARHDKLRDFRVGYVLNDPLMPVSAEIQPALESTIQALEKGGARMQPGWPAGFSFQEMFSTYLVMLAAFNFSIAPPVTQVRQRAEWAAHEKPQPANPALIEFAAWHRHNLQRLAYRALWQNYFRDVDVFLLPALPVPAFPHDHSDKDTRRLQTPQGPLPYMQALRAYASVATLTGCPATVAPSGKTSAGLPVGIQIIGPYLEDRTPIRLAALLAAENGGFTPPPGY